MQTTRLLAKFACAALTALQMALAAPGDLDLSFGGTGKVTADFGGSDDYGNGVAVQSDGKIVVAGSSYGGGNGDFSVVRYNANGSVDTSFNGTGKITTDFNGEEDVASSVTVQRDGKIVVAGYARSGGLAHFAVARYETNGSLDMTFNGGGKVTTSFGGRESGASVVVQSDGKIVVAGYAYPAFGGTDDIALARFNSDGSLDTEFGNGGKVTTGISNGYDNGFGVALQSDGKIVVSGSAQLSGDDIAVVRYTANGTLDTSFGGTGYVVTDLGGGNDFGGKVTVQSNGKILVAGNFFNGSHSDFALLRYNTNGSLDTSFNGTGIVTTAVGTGAAAATGVVAQSDGKIIVAGYADNGSNWDFALVRYNANGSLDMRFNGTGKVTTAIGGGTDFGSSVALQSDGKVVVAGYSYNGSSNDFAVVRYLGDAPFTITGVVRDGAGLPLAGALVTVKRGSTVYWQGTSTADGTFQDAAASVGSYNVIVTKAGYGTYVSNFDWTGGSDQILNVTLNALPTPLATVAVSQIPPSTAIGQCRAWSQSNADAPKLFLLGTNGQFTSSLTNLNPSRATVVITHGWIPTGSGASIWPNQLATLIQQNQTLGAAAPNILVWDWHKDAEADRPPIDRAACEGLELGKALLQSLGSGYNQRVHFIGHSLGTISNAYACDYAHGSFARSTSNPASHWNALATKPHMTLFDEAEVASIFGSQVLTSAEAAWKATQLKAKLLNGAVTAATVAATWKSPIPKTATAWIDNYISAVGFHRDEAVNVCLLTPTLTLNTQPGSNLGQQLADAHSYSHLWYRNSVGHAFATPQPSFGSSFEAGGTLPPSGVGMAVGNDWFEHLNTSDPFDLTRNPLDLNPVGLVVANADFPILLGLTVLPVVQAVAQGAYDVTVLPLDATGKAVLRGYDAGIQWAGDVGATVIYKSGQVTTAAKEKVGIWWDAAKDAGSNFLNSIDPNTLLTGPVSAPVFSIILSSQAAAPAQPEQNVAGISPPPPANQPAYAWLTVNVPANAGMLAFDFTVTGDPVDDSIACAVNGQNIFTLPAKFAPDDSPVSTDMMDISAYAGQSVELFFGLVDGTSTNCQVAIDGIRFITIPQPKVGVVASGANVAVKWPAAAVGWVLETSDTLAPNSWQPVPMTGVAVASGVATIEQPRSSTRRFYRLRRSP